MIRWIVVFIIISLNIIFQSTIAQEISFNGITFNLLLITTVSFGLMRGKVEGTIIGFSLGFLQDIFYGSVLGFYGLIYMYIGFICGYFNRSFYRDSLIIPFLIIGCFDFSVNIIIYIFTYFFRGRMYFPYYLTNIIIPEVIYTLFLSLFIYKLYLTINHILERYEVRKEEADS